MPHTPAMRAPRLKGTLAAALLVGALEACWLTSSLSGSDAGTTDAGTRDASRGDVGADVGRSRDSGSDGSHTEASPSDATHGNDAADGSTRGDTGNPIHDAGNPTHDAGSPYRALVLEAGPLVYYRLGESSGSMAQSEVLPNEPAMYEQVFTLQQDGAILYDPNTALALNGSGCINMNAASALSFTGRDPITIEVWVKPTVIDIGYRNIFIEEVDGGANGFALFLHQPDGGAPTMSFQRHAMGMLTTVNVPAPAPDVFTHVAAVYDGAALRLYKNGILIAPSPVPDTASAGGVAGTARGGCGASGVGFDGTIDEIAIYAKALSLTEIANHYGLGKNGTLADGG